MYYYGARYYDPEIGRFNTIDPIRDGLNWYEYCLSNPLKYIDLLGLDAGWASNPELDPPSGTTAPIDTGYYDDWDSKLDRAKNFEEVVQLYEGRYPEFEFDWSQDPASINTQLYAFLRGIDGDLYFNLDAFVNGLYMFGAAYPWLSAGFFLAVTIGSGGIDLVVIGAACLVIGACEVIVGAVDVVNALSGSEPVGNEAGGFFFYFGNMPDCPLTF